MCRVRGKPVAVFLGISILALSIWTSAAWSAEAKGGKATYDKLCVSCHGADGKGNAAMIKVFGEKLNIATKGTSHKKDEELFKVITEGQGKMPAAGKGLSKQEQKEVVEHVRSLAK